MMEADLDRDGKIGFEEFTKMVENTDVSMSMTLGMLTPPPLGSAIEGATIASTQLTLTCSKHPADIAVAEQI